MNAVKKEIVVFDLGEVLSRPVNLLARLGTVVGLPAAAFADTYWQWRGEYDKGMSPLDYWTKVFEGAPSPQGTEVQITESLAKQLSQTDCQAWTQLAPTELRILQLLKESGATLVLLSNSPTCMGQAVRAEAWSELFEKVFISAEVGIAKPDPRIFSLVEEQLGIANPSQILFFDDRQENVDAARACGWEGELWESSDQLARELVARGFTLRG